LPKLLTRTRCGYFLVEPKNARQDLVRAQFGRWIVEQATDTPPSAFQSTGAPPVSQTALSV
jgi:hypothetical protein